MKFIPRVLLAVLIFLVGCGGNGGFSNSPSITLNPPEASSLPNGTVQFSIQEGVFVDWSAPDGGTVSNSGLFTAPGTAGTYRVVATNIFNPTLSDTANVIVSDVQVSVVPGSIVVPRNSVNPDAFKALVVGSPNKAVTWTATGGAISASSPDPSGNPRATFTAGNVPGTFTVRATSAADPSVSAISQVTILGSSSLALSPTSATLGTTSPNNSATFIAVLTDASGNLDETTVLTWDLPVNGVGATLSGSALRQRTVTVPTSFVGVGNVQLRARTPQGVAATVWITVRSD